MKLQRLFYYLSLVLLVTACAAPQKTSLPLPTPGTETRQQNELLQVNYQGFTVWLDCKERAAVRFRYNTQHDTGSEPRRENFTFDPSVPRECQQISTKGYGNNYDRGHQVPANHLDYSALAIKQSNYMTNILPQAAGMNRGAWLLTEEIIECYRDIDELSVLGGVIWGRNTDNDLFVTSHGVRTPDAFWKVIIRGKNEVIAWVIPNTQEAKRENLDDYLVSVADIEKMTGEKIPISGDARTRKLKNSWLVPVGCNKN
jgi:endonuclease G, mitochondrial